VKAGKVEDIYELDSFKKHVFPVLLDSKTFNQNKDTMNILKFHSVEVARQVILFSK
jgi:hypothetical protein